MRSRSWLLWWLAAMLLAACGGVVSDLDAGVTAPDGGTETDAGTGRDAGTEDDAGTVSDAGLDPEDAGTDAGAADDAGVDAGPVDAGAELDSGIAADAGVRLPDGGCNPAAFLRLAWPLPGTGGLDWVVNNYVDLDTTAGALRDFTGATSSAKTYDGHRGIDIDVPSFRQMDGDFPVIAAAPGVITTVVDGNFDRNTSCASNNANLVRVRQDDCSSALYAHFKTNSIVVAVGQRVVTGQKLAVVGSSGCSSQAHLHFELTAASGVLEEPFGTGRWLTPPPYSPPLSVMDVNFKAGSYSAIGELLDPPPDPTTLSPGAIGIAGNVAGGGPGDVLNLRLLQPDGGVSATGATPFSQEWRHSFWWWNRTLGSARGTWRIEVRANNGPVTSRSFTVP